MVEVFVSQLKIDELNWRSAQVVYLKEKNGEREFPIFIGFFEAQAIYLKINQITAPRPFTHDLLVDLLTLAEGKLLKIIINDLKGETFYAQLLIARTGDRVDVVDARPSDAIAIALRCNAPIFVDDSVFDTLDKEEKP